jgi:hypothetical protein
LPTLSKAIAYTLVNDAAVPVASVEPATPEPANTLTLNGLATAEVGAPGGPRHGPEADTAFEETHEAPTATRTRGVNDAPPVDTVVVEPVKPEAMVDNPLSTTYVIPASSAVPGTQLTEHVTPFDDVTLIEVGR